MLPANTIRFTSDGDVYLYNTLMTYFFFYFQTLLTESYYSNVTTIGNRSRFHIISTTFIPDYWRIV